MKRVTAIILTLGLACGPELDTPAMLLLEGAAPVCTEPPEWSIDGDSIPEGVPVAIAVAEGLAPCVLVAPHGTLSFQLLPFYPEPGGALVDGYVSGASCNPRIRVATWARPVEQTALSEELGHVTWLRCGLPHYDEQRGCHPPAFLRWVWQVDAQTAAALGHPAPPPWEPPPWACPE